MTERAGFDHITAACLASGEFTLSAGTMDPAIVLKRLLAALAILSPSAHDRLIALDGPFAAVPQAALRDGSSVWWSTNEAGVFLQSLLDAINAGAPHGYVCCYTASDRIGLVRIDGGIGADGG